MGAVKQPHVTLPGCPSGCGGVGLRVKTKRHKTLAYKCSKCGNMWPRFAREE